MHPMTGQELTRDTLNRILEAPNLESLTFEQISTFFLEDADIAKFAPDGICQVDPRNGDRIVFNSARARRPHDNRPDQKMVIHELAQRDCLICQGRTTGIIDTTDLSEGFTFINKNLFPIFYPHPSGEQAALVGNNSVIGTAGLPSYGMHFLQWTSSLHHKDWQNMPQLDRITVMRRLAALEKKLLSESSGYVSIIKNYGHLVGGSLAHGHQQIGFSNIMPRRIQQDLNFKEEYNETFTRYLLRENPTDLTIRDYGAAILLVPYFMRRPFDMFLVLTDTTKGHLYDLNKQEVAAIADGWRDAIRVILLTMPQIGRETAYNITTHNGFGAGLYFEFLPYTQEMGGFEHLGLYLCQGNPAAAAAHAREILQQDLDTRFATTSMVE
jgi:galactose-1-phosphate uridylyltransferase